MGYDTGPFERITRAPRRQIIAWDPQFIGGTYSVNLPPGGGTATRGLDGQLYTPRRATRLWRVSFSMNTIRPKHVRRFRSLIAEIADYGQIIRFPVLDRYAPTAEALAGPPRPPSITHSDGVRFSDGAGYSPEYLVIPRSVVGSIGEGETTMTIAGDWDNVLEAGVYFNIGNDLHIVRHREAGAENIIHFAPGARRTHTRPVINAATPVLHCRLSSGSDGSLPLEMTLFGKPNTFEFEEAIL